MIKQIKNESSSRQKIKFMRKQLYPLDNSKTLQSSLEKKTLINRSIYGMNNQKKINPYFKNFNVRKVIKTQSSLPISKEKDNLLSLENKIKIQNVLKKNALENKILVNKGSSKNKIPEIKSLNNSINLLQKNKYQSYRQQPEQISFLKKKNSSSPYKQKNRFRTLQSHSQQKSLNYNDQENLQQKRSKYYYLTKFQKQQIQLYDIYFPGYRRISSLKQFTDLEGNCKILIGDSIIYRYEIIKVLGQGSFGQVFKAYDHKKKQQVAIKIIKNSPKFNKQARTALLHENNHYHNIVKLKHGFFFRSHACLVFELLHINLYEFLRLYNFKGLSLDFIRRLTIQILQGLLFFQKFNIVHCDLKPENILLKQENKTGIKIIDVGSGCFEKEQLYTYIQSRFYRAPEIIIGIQYTSAIDIWSFACILCELYTGYPIFPGESEQEQIKMQIQVLNNPPAQFIDRGSRSHRFFDGYVAKHFPNTKGKQRIAGSSSLSRKLKNCEDKKFITFLQKCFKWLPEERFKPHQALLDEWILQGLPVEIINQHVQMVKVEAAQFFS